MPGDAHMYLHRQLNLKIYTNPWPRIMNSAKRNKTLAGSQAAHMQSLAQKKWRCGDPGRLPKCSPRPPLFTA